MTNRSVHTTAPNMSDSDDEQNKTIISQDDPDKKKKGEELAVAASSGTDLQPSKQDQQHEQLMMFMASINTRFDNLQMQLDASRTEAAKERAARCEMEQRLLNWMSPPGPSGYKNGPQFTPSDAKIQSLERNTESSTSPKSHPNATNNNVCIEPTSNSSSTSQFVTKNCTSISDARQSTVQEFKQIHSIQNTAIAQNNNINLNQPPVIHNINPALQWKLIDLPEFSGLPEQWPRFIASFRQSTEAFGYNELQNNFRLQKCLKGEALETVQSLLIHPHNQEALIRQLEFRFGRPEFLVQDQIAKIRESPQISEWQYNQLVPYSTRVQNLVAFLDTDSSRHVLLESSLLAELVIKLPASKRLEWAQHSMNIVPRPTAIDFSNWLQVMAQCVSTISAQLASVQTGQSNNQQRQRQDKRVLLHVAQAAATSSCDVCNRPHTMIECNKFHRMPTGERWAVARRLALCFGCLRAGHKFDDCENKSKCSSTGCLKFHHDLLHSETTITDNPTAQNESIARNITTNPFAKNTSTVLTCIKKPEKFPLLFRIVPVILRGPGGQIQTFALLDDGSALTLMDSDVADHLQLSGPNCQLNVHWFGGHSTSSPSNIVSVEIKGTSNESPSFSLNNVRTVNNLNLPLQSLTISGDARHQHLQNLAIEQYHLAEPKILIGLDNSELTLASETRTNPHGGPIAVKTPLGWIAYGHQKKHDLRTVLHLSEEERHSYDHLEQIVRDYHSTENFGIHCPNPKMESDDDIRAREILKNTTIRLDSENRFQTGLLWRKETTQLPDSYHMALGRLRSLERKTNRDHAYAALYAQQIDSYITKGYAIKLSTEEIAVQNQRTWYLPHFGHTSIHKPGKLRIVFDAAAAVDGISLNSELIKGPDLNQSLTTIMYQFRMRPIAVCGDIAEMFHQVVVQASDRSAQRFLWRTDPKMTPDIYQMQVMTFGATCSPTSAQFVKNLNASQHENEFPAAAEAIRSLHYVDDYVASFDTVNEAIQVTKDVIEVHRRGGFTLRGFVSNSQTVLNSLGESKMIKSVNMERDPNTTDKILGLRWCSNTDTFVFKIRFENVNTKVITGAQTPTKREILSVTMSVFDPFGFLANYMLHAKLMIQALWRTATDWDEQVPEIINKRWRVWCKEIERIQDLQIPRCHSEYLTTTLNLQLHIFGDASEEAFAAVAYWRLVYNGICVLSFVAGKTKCAPLKRLSVPRLELQAAVLAVRIYQSIRTSHPNLKIQQTVMWTDSTTVIGWIRSVNRKFPQFVAHRVGEILDSTCATWWRWLPTKDNVADDATRGKDQPRFDPTSRWINGPPFLLEDESEWPSASPASDSSTHELMLEEIRPDFVGIVVSDGLIDFNRFSNFNRICRTLGWVNRFINNVRAQRNGRSTTKGELSSVEIHSATKQICRLAQLEAFPKEYAALKSGVDLPPASPVRTLLPYIDDAGVMRIFGRTDAANNQHLSQNAQRPILLSNGHRFTQLIVHHHHRKMGHQLEDATICSIRQQFWVPHLRRLVRSVKRQCRECYLRSIKPHPPIAGQLPIDRLTPNVFAFTFTGLDYFGPIVVSSGRRQEKRWIALFTCMTTRALHMEVATDLSTDACLVAIRNFINTRGVPARIRSDCGTNFVGADNELRRTQDFLDVAAIQRELATRGIEWIFNCPANPEAGGAWERLVQATKRVLRIILKSTTPRVETLRSFVIEAANIINSRPLTHVPVHPDDPEPITPNHFLMGRANSTTAPAATDMKQLSQRKQWLVCRELRNQFWSRWIREYLPELTRRSKYYEDVKPIQEGDLVLVCDVNESRGQWTRGIVEHAVRGTDGRVRTAEIRTNTGLMRRPVTKLAKIDVTLDGEP